MGRRWEKGPEHDGSHPILILPRVPRPRAIALVLHGGAPDSTTGVTKFEPALLRMLPFAQHIEVRSGGRIGAAILRDAVRGYNGAERSPVHDARWAVQRLQERYPGLPTGLVGHSMGGRVALELAGTEGVSTIVGLAPWIPQQYDVAPFLPLHTLLMHGRQDTMTDARESEKLVNRIRTAGGDAAYRQFNGSHAMLWRPGRWHRHTTAFLRLNLLAR